MKSLLLMTFMAAILSSCGGGSGGSGEGGKTPESPFSIIFPDLKTHGNSLSYVVRGESNKEFSAITIYRTDACNSASQVMMATRSNLISGITIHFPTPNESYDLYYSVSNSSGTIVECAHLVNYTHDNVAPVAPVTPPPELLALNGSRTRHVDISVSMNESFLSGGADGIRVYGNLSRTQYFGEILRESFSNGTFKIIPNVTNSLFISNVDYAGNESSLIAIGVYVTNDSVAPTTPTLGIAHPIYTPIDNFSLLSNFSGDSVRVRYRNITTGQEDVRTGSAITTSSQIVLVQNQLNQIAITSFDDVGNESLPLNVSIYHDNIAPSAPVLHESLTHTISLPFKGPENLMRLVADSGTTVTLYNDLMTILASGPASTWADGINFTFQNANGPNTIYAVSRDLAGNTSPQTIINFIADSIAPGAVSLDPETLSLDGSYVNYDTITIKGLTSGDAYRVSVTGGVSTFYGDVSEIQEGLDYKLRLNDLNVIEIVVYDIAGNESIITVLNITHDNISPVVGVTYPLSGLTVRGDGVLSGTCESLPLSITIGVFVDTVPCSVGNWEYTLNGSFVHGQQISINMSQSDVAGNIGYATSSVSVDNVAPILTYSPSTIPASTNNKNHIVTGTCESGLMIASSGDSLGTYSCHDGSYIAPLDVSTEGLKNITFSTADYARNATSVSFSVNFDFVAPTSIVLDYETTKFHNSAVDSPSVIFRGTNPEASSSVLIARDSNGVIVIGTYTTAELASGISVPLLINQLNGIYVFAVDEAGNRSIPAYISIHRRQILSRHYIVLNAALDTSNPVGEGVDYRYTLKLQNASYDVNVGAKVRVSNIEASSINPEIVVDSASECLTREIEALDSCDISFTVNYARDPLVTQTNVLHNNFITLTFPDATTQRINIRQVSASVQAESIQFTGGLAESSNNNNIFTEFLSEAFTGNSFVTMNSFMDFNLITKSSTDLSKKRRFQANSLTKNFAICSSPATRLCVNANLNVNMPETIIGDLPFSNSLLSDSYGDSDIGVFYIGAVGDTDIIVAGKHKDIFSSSATQESGVVFYDISDKLPTVVKIATVTSPYMTFSYPHSGSMLQNGNVYVVGTSSTETVLFRVNVSTKAISKVSDLAMNSGYSVAGSHVLFTDLSGALRFVDSGNGSVDEIAPSFPLGQMICNYGAYERGSVRSIEERVTYAETGSQVLLPMCNNSGAPVMYVHYSPATGLREVISLAAGSGNNFKIKYVNQPDVNNMSFGIQSLSLGETRHFIYNISTEVFNSMTSSLDSTAHIIGNRVFVKDGTSLVEMDKSFNIVSLIEDMGHENWVLIRSLNSLFIYNKIDFTVKYFDTVYNQTLSYQTYNLPRSSMVFEGFFRGFMYFRSQAGINYMIDRFPLYAK